jgi:hypothetical protein
MSLRDIAEVGGSGSPEIEPGEFTDESAPLGPGGSSADLRGDDIAYQIDTARRTLDACADMAAAGVTDVPDDVLEID